jgi:hypothetical protein
MNERIHVFSSQRVQCIYPALILRYVLERGRIIIPSELFAQAIVVFVLSSVHWLRRRFGKLGAGPRQGGSVVQLAYGSTPGLPGCISANTITRPLHKGANPPPLSLGPDQKKRSFLTLYLVHGPSVFGRRRAPRTTLLQHLAPFWDL